MMPMTAKPILGLLGRRLGFEVFGGGKKGALMIRIEFWGPLCYSYNKEPPRIVLVIV